MSIQSATTLDFQQLQHIINTQGMTPLNQNMFAIILRAQLEGRANLPYGLGLEIPVYKDVLNATHNHELIKQEQHHSLLPCSPMRQRSALINILTENRMQERNDLVELLFQHAEISVPFATQMAIVIATACLAPAHLWKTLGLNRRFQLRQLLTHNFPTLVDLNEYDMRWKRFFYLQLCKSEGDYVCRSPSCNSCSSYRECFVLED